LSYRFSGPCDGVIGKPLGLAAAALPNSKPC
jgi:hypothetical protein